MNAVRRAMQSMSSIGSAIGRAVTCLRVSRRGCAPGSGPASVVRAIAGTPAGMVRGERRGTILVIVLGTLALMAVIAVVYVVVGRADRRQVAAFESSARREEMPVLVRDYIAAIVGRDAVATYRDGAGTLKREAFDYPFSDPLLRSVLPGEAGVSGVLSTPPGERMARRFNAEGTFDSPNQVQDPPQALTGSLGTVFEPRVPADPWLASTQATNLLLSDDLTDGAFPQYEMRDWAHITNIAPDGRYVNLFNLRNNFGAGAGFDRGEDEISSRLTLTNADGSSQPAGSNQIMADGATASPNTPAHWSSAQIGAFRPTNAPMLTPQPRGGAGEPTPIASPIPSAQSPWSYAEYAPYQWADTDGDGFYDARWQELVDASDGIDTAFPLFPRDDGFRWFIAARVQDLSACLNVNTATDFLADPSTSGANASEYAGVGATPADVDLRRLLTGEDLWEMSGYVGYRGARPPTVAPNSVAIDANSAQYYGLTGGEIFTPLSDPSSAGHLMVDVGDAAYNTARAYLQFGLVPIPRVRLEAPGYTDFLTYLNQQLGYAQVYGAPANSQDLLRFTAASGVMGTPIEDRRDWYRTSTGVVTSANQTLSTSVFGLDSEVELRTYRTANDPAFQSPLELVMDGRVGDNTLYPPPNHSSRYGVLRNNRGLAVDLLEPDRSRENPAASGGSGLIAPGTIAGRDQDGLADLDAMTRSMVDLRQYLTTVSAARPLASVPVFGTWKGNGNTNEYREVRYGEDPRKSSLWAVPPLSLTLSSADVPQLLDSQQMSASMRVPGIKELFRAYCDALLPYSYLPQAWNRSAAGNSYRTLSYGYEGAELALRHAAHMAVNMRAAVRDNPGGPTSTTPFAYTVLANERAMSALMNDTGAMSSRSYPWSWFSDANQRLDLNEPLTGTVRRERLADDSSAASAPINAAYTVFPVQPQPVLTEVSGFCLYTDAPPPLGDNEATDITINGAHAATNNDLAWQGLAFQITNPFPSQITINPDEYYVECVGATPEDARYFRLPSSSGAVTLSPHETIVLYAQLRDDATTMMKWEQYDAGSGAKLDQFRNALMAVNAVPPRPLEEFNPDPQGDPTPPGGGIFEDLGGNFATEFRLWHVQRVTSAGETDFASNVRGNDVLIDRLHDPRDTAGDPTLESVKLNGGMNRQINGATAMQVVGQPDYNEGITILLWSTMRRPSDPQATAASNKDDIVWLPAYCIERKFSDAGGMASLNVSEPDGLKHNNLDNGDIDSESRPEIALKFSIVLGDILGGDTIVETLVTRPEDKTDDPMGSNIAGTSWEDVRDELYTAIGGDGARDLRPADMLIPPAIGPSVEAVFSGSTFADLTPLSYTTLGEAMALALDYDADPNLGVPGMSTLLARPARPVTMGTPLDRGSLVNAHLVLDDFVPFYDATPDGQVYNPAQGDVLFDEGQPLALRVIDRFRSLGDEYGNQRRPIPGLININTAPLAVLRTLPMLSPSQGADPTSPGAPFGSAWWGAASGQTMASDVASSVVAYRDRIAMFPRADEMGNLVVGDDFIDFSAEGNNDPAPRGLVSGIAGVREIPGFRSVAELLDVRNNSFRTSGTPSVSLHDMDRLGFDDARIDLNGVRPIFWANVAAGNPVLPKDGFDERLAILSALENCVTVRSDVYCVWFVLHGYREQDCTGLNNSRNQAEPLLPSVSRRFVMILDRSGVVGPSDHPKILLFQEVPYSPTSAGDGSAI